MTVTLDFQTDDAGVEAMLARVNAAVSPEAMVEFLTGEVVPWLNERGKMRFENEGDEVSGRWEELAESTQQIRAAGAARGEWQIGPDHPINVRTHELEDYITSTIGYVVPFTEGATLTFPDPKALNDELREKMITAQRGKNGTPARPVLGLGEADTAWVLERLAMHITGAVEVAEAVTV